MSIILEAVSHIYMAGTPYERTALNNVSLAVERGEFVGIIGHTGSGKSTLVQHMNGLIKPTRGRVLVDGADLAVKGQAARLARRKVGMVFQYPEHQLFEETVFEDVAFGPRNLGLGPEEVEKRVQQSLKIVGLDYDDYAGRSPFRLSGGQMRRVAIAGVLALEPEYLILDEPSAGLDPRGRDEIFGQIARLHRETGVTVILISHNMEEVARLVRRVIVMHRAEVSLDGTPQEVFRQGAEKLNQAGVEVPNVTALLARLQAQGLAVDDTAVTAEEASRAILEALRRRGAC
ncbi:MAG TPA: energy-coupling factor transporter ATPase [Selenomonadales bacterium]|nr:energy-coupling factor transporter ATPase [Selenomonadales bacterium]